MRALAAASASSEDRRRSLSSRASFGDARIQIGLKLVEPLLALEGARDRLVEPLLRAVALAGEIVHRHLPGGDLGVARFDLAPERGDLLAQPRDVLRLFRDLRVASHDVGRALAERDLRRRPFVLGLGDAAFGEREVDRMAAAQSVAVGLSLGRRQRRGEAGSVLGEPEGAARDGRQREEGEERRRQGAEQHIYRRLNQGALTSTPPGTMRAVKRL